MDCSLPAPLSMGFSRQEYWSGLPCPPPGDLPNPGIEPRSPVLQADSLQAEPQGKPKNTGVGSLSLLQQIFPIQESNWGLQHCRQILYQLSYEGSLVKKYLFTFQLFPQDRFPEVELQVKGRDFIHTQTHIYKIQITWPSYYHGL